MACLLTVKFVFIKHFRAGQLLFNQKKESSNMISPQTPPSSRRTQRGHHRSQSCRCACTDASASNSSTTSVVQQLSKLQNVQCRKCKFYHRRVQSSLCHFELNCQSKRTRPNSYKTGAYCSVPTCFALALQLPGDFIRVLYSNSQRATGNTFIVALKITDQVGLS